jgi:hypothetical protein
MGMTEQRILLVSWDSILLETRILVLRTRFLAEGAATLSEVDVLARREQFHLVVICQTLSDVECILISQKFGYRRSYPHFLFLVNSDQVRPRSLSGRSVEIDGPINLLEECAISLGQLVRAEGGVIELPQTNLRIEERPLRSD